MCCRLEELNEKKDSMVQRVKVAEKDKTGLEVLSRSIKIFILWGSIGSSEVLLEILILQVSSLLSESLVKELAIVSKRENLLQRCNSLKLILAIPLL